MPTINDVELRIAQQIAKPLREIGILPEGYQCAVRLHGRQRDKRRSADFENSWSPDNDSIRIEFEPTSEGEVAAAESVAPPGPNEAEPISELVRALDRVESRPGYDFISLKWFRDTALPVERFPWTADTASRHLVLRDAIEKRLVLTHKVSNPKAPQFPVTAIRLNRLSPDVNAVLGTRDRRVSDFRPVPIRGEALSVTVLRDRR